MKPRILMCSIAMTLFAALAVPVRLAAQNNQDRKDARFITFDAPGAGTGRFQGTFAQSINAANVIAGFYYDASNVFHGFLRARDGAITTFDAPGAGLGTVPQSINVAGAIAGYYFDASSAVHGFLRARNGAITTFDAPGAGLGTEPQSINAVGAIAGYYYDGSAAFHGFLRMPCGAGDHSDENCEDNAVGATATTQRSPAPITQGMSTASPAK
jgi:hypothetical protein